MPAIPETNTLCRDCGAPLPTGALACAKCGALVHRDDLERLSADALRTEVVNPAQAADFWRQALKLLPPDSHQHRVIQDRIATLAPGGAGIATGTNSWALAIAKTGGSMLLSIFVYYFYAGQHWGFAIGIVVLILVHEMGHVIANAYYGISSSPPIFIPFMGAVIMLRGRLANAKVEAISAIAGPIAGSLGALPVYLFYLKTGNPLALFLAHIGFFINLFNLLPVPPLDGGRVTAAMNPRIWVLGLIAMGLIVADDMRHGRDASLLIFILVIALPRIITTLKGGRKGDYYNIGRRASFTIGAAYLLLLALLAAAHYATNRDLGRLKDDIEQSEIGDGSGSAQFGILPE